MMRVPLGVIGIIYESRPNVTADAAGALPQVRQRDDPARRLGGDPQQPGDRRAASTKACATPACRRTRCSWSTRPTAPPSGYLIADDAHVDVIVPRGGKGLIERVAREARCR